jgi:ABC-type Zn uptake system ZnuABC Zn-binding protein ZnuA
MKLLKYLIALLIVPLTISAKVKVVAAISDLAYFADKIGGEFVDVSYIAPPTADVHYIEARPSYMVKLANANVALKIGLEQDMWMDQLIDGSRNNHLTIVDCSKYVKALEIPAFKADARYGDLHRFGNPHYWIGPQNAQPISDAIVEGLSKADPQHAEMFAANQEKLLAEISSAIELVHSKLDQLKGKSIVFYHNSWPYFNEFAGTTAAQFIEPYPGVAPSPSHIKKLTELMIAGKIKVIAMEPYFDKRVPEKLARETGAKVVMVYPSIGGRDQNESYAQWLEYNVDALLNAAK